MEGKVKIVVKDKKGNVKVDTTKKNKVFDLPKEILKMYIERGAFLRQTKVLKDTNPYSDWNKSIFMNKIFAYADWFGAIKINDEECSETDFRDWKYPVLTGGTYARSNTNNVRYVQEDTVQSTMVDNVYKRVFTWNNCPAFTMKSINLCNYINGYGSFIYYPYNFIPSGRCFFEKKGNYLWKVGANVPGNSPTVTTVPSACNALFTEGVFQFSNSRKARTKVLYNWSIKSTTSSSSTSMTECFNTINALAGNEIALFRRNLTLKSGSTALNNVSDLADDNTTYTTGFDYIVVFDSETGAIKRTFQISANFKAHNELYSQNQTSVKFHSIDYGNGDVRNYIVVFGSNYVSGTRTYYADFFKLPDTSVTGQQTPIESFEVSSYVKEASFWLRNYLIYWSSTSGYAFKFSLDSDNQEVIEKITRPIFNCSTSTYTSGELNSPHIFDDTQSVCIPESVEGLIPAWFNTTVLNLDGVEIEEGDTLQIEYTITATTI